MIHAYNELYLNRAMTTLGNTFAFAVDCAGYAADDVFDLFILSGIAESFGKGNPKYVAGRFAQELFCEILSAANIAVPETFVMMSASYGTIEYDVFWCGWILAYYQWYYNADFSSIRKKLSFRTLLELYPTLHETDKQKAIEVLHERINPKTAPTRLQILRKKSGLSQNDLAALSGVAIRSIQMYEQRNKDINKAKAETIRALAKSLCCNMDELLEN